MVDSAGGVPRAEAPATPPVQPSPELPPVTEVPAPKPVATPTALSLGRPALENRYKEIRAKWGSKKYGKTWKPDTPLEVKVEAERLREELTVKPAGAPAKPAPAPTMLPAAAKRSEALPAPSAAIQAKLSEATKESGLAASQLFPDDRIRDAIREQGFQSFDVEDQAKVVAGVRAGIEDDKVFRRVIESVPRDVMDGLGAKKGAPEGILHDKAVLIEALAVPVNVPVPASVARVIDALAAQGLTVTRPTAEPPAIGRDVGRASMKRRPASQASIGKGPGEELAGASATTEGQPAGVDLGGRSGKGRPAEKTRTIDAGHITSPESGTGQGGERAQTPSPPPSIQKAEVPATGKVTTAYTPKGQSIKARYTLVEAADLVASHDFEGRQNPEYPRNLQPRDRSRQASILQIARIAGNLAPERLGASPTVSEGAPIVGSDKAIESGNGRVLAIRKAYRGEKGKAYRQHLQKNAAEFGLDPTAVEAMTAPVLVRVRTTKMSDAERAAFARDANESTTARMSPAEEARADAARIGTDLDDYFPAEDGNVLAMQNRGFVKRFIAGLASEEAAALTTAEGAPTKQLGDRIRAAVFYSAYQDERLLALFAEEADPEIRNVIGALNRAAPALARAHALDAKLGDTRFVEYLVDAVDLMRETKATGQAMDERMRQQDAFTRVPRETETLARYLALNNRSAKRMGDALTRIGQSLERDARHRLSQDLFGKKTETLPETLDRVLAAGAIEVPAQGDLLVASPLASYRVMEADFPVTGEVRAARRREVPLTEREIRKRKRLSPTALTAPETAKTVLAEIARGRDGVVLLDGQHYPVGFVPMSAEEAAKLRSDQVGEGASRLLQAIHMTNAGAMMATFVDDNPAVQRAVKNLGAFARDTETRFLDAFAAGSSFKAQGREMEQGGPYYSRGARSFGQADGLFEKAPAKVAQLTGPVFPNAKAALRYALAHLRGTYRNRDTGWDISVARLGLEKALSHSGRPSDLHLNAVRALPKLLDHAVLAESKPDAEGDRNIRAIHRFYAPLRIGTSLYRVKMTVKETTLGRKFYDQSLTEIETANVPLVGESRSPQGAQGTRTATGPLAVEVSIADLLRGAVRDSDGQPFAAEAGQRYSYLGSRGAKTPKLALAAAREFATQGIAMEEIRKTTGWHRAVDGKWRYEISDAASKLRPGYRAGETVGDVLDHAILFDNYQSLRDINIEWRTDLPENVRGGYERAGNAIHLNANRAPDDIKSTLLHELQHAVQLIEGFARGGSPKNQDFISAAAAMGIDTADQGAVMAAYRRLLGEVEARDVQARRTLTAEELRERPPYVSQGILESDLIVRHRGETAADIVDSATRAAVSAATSMGEVAAAALEAVNRGVALHTPATLRHALSDRLGKRAFAKLVGSMAFRIVGRDADLPAGLQHPEGGVRGVYDKGVSYLVAGNIPIGDEFGVLLHELGVHHGLEGLLGPKLHGELLGQIKAILAPLEKAIADGKSEAELAKIRERIAGLSPLHAALVEARAQVPNDTATRYVTEETLAYLVEARANHNLPLVRRILAAVRAFLLRQGIPLKNVTPDDLVALARASVRAVSRGETVQRGATMAPAYARASKTLTPAERTELDALNRRRLAGEVLTKAERARWNDLEDKAKPNALRVAGTLAGTRPRAGGGPASLSPRATRALSALQQVQDRHGYATFHRARAAAPEISKADFDAGVLEMRERFGLYNAEREAIFSEKDSALRSHDAKEAADLVEDPKNKNQSYGFQAVYSGMFLRALPEEFRGETGGGQRYSRGGQTETPEFKRWFGDWQKAEQHNFLDGPPVASMRGTEVPVFPKITTLAEWVADYFIKQHDGKAIHPLLGEVLLDKRAARDSVAHGLSRIKAQGFYVAGDIIEKGRLLDSSPDLQGKPVKWHTVAAPVRIVDKDYIGIAVIRTTEGAQRMYLHEVALKERLRRPSKTGAATEVVGLTGSGQAGVIRSIVESVTSFNPTRVSKVVDKDGKPLVVYHGTRADADVDAFTLSKGGMYFTDSAEDAGTFSTFYPASGASGPSRVMPVFLSIRNPMTRDMEGELFEPKVIEEEIAEANANGHDGVILNDIVNFEGAVPSTTYIAFEPEQVKSSTGHVGTFDPQNPDIRYSRGAPPAGILDRGNLPTVSGILDRGNLPRVREWFAPRLDLLRIKLQDRFLSLKRHQQAVEARKGPLPENADSYLALTLYHGRAETRTKDLKTQHIDPLIEAIHASRASIEQVDDFLYALHAEERNILMASRNPRFDPDSAEYGGVPGSGMTSEEAAAIAQAARDAGLYDDLMAISRQVQAINEATLDARLRDGLMSQEQVDEWRGMWKYYVPLRGVEGKDELPRIGRGFHIAGAESKHAFGRASKAGDLLAHVVSQAEEAIVRGEKNRVGQTFLKFVEENPSEHWQPKAVQFKPAVDPETGEMTFERDPFYTLADNVLTIKRDGEQFHVKLADEALARSLKNLGAEDMNGIVRTVGTLTRALSFLSTSANPEFLISNFARDIQEAGINLAGEQGAAMAKKVMRNVPKALRGAYRAIRKGDTTDPWARHFRELQAAGGLVGHMDSLSIEQQAGRLEGMLKDLDPSKPRQAWLALRGLGHLIQDTNTVVESGVRVSAYVAAREAGMSKDRAAALAKNLTVNFNRRGELGPVMNSLYMFFNAGVQGTTRLIQALGHPRTQKIVGGIVGLGVLMEILNQAMSGSGDDDKKYYDQIPTWVKDHNLIIMMPDGEHYAMLPLPYGYNTFHALGRNLGSMFFGASPVEAAGAIAHAGLEAFNPLGGATSLLQFLSPTLIDPFVQQAENLSHFGTPIKPDSSPFGPPKPESSLYWGSVNPLAKDVAAWLNDATGGSPVRPGGVDISPEIIEHWTEFMGGGVGRTLVKTLNTGTRLATGEDLPIKEIPFLRRVFGEADERSSAGVYREYANEVVRARDEIKFFRGPGGDPERAAEVAREHRAELRLYPFAHSTDNQISALNRRLRLLESRGAPRSVRDPITERIEMLKARFIRRYEAGTAL